MVVDTEPGAVAWPRGRFSAELVPILPRPEVAIRTTARAIAKSTGGVPGEAALPIAATERATGIVVSEFTPHGVATAAQPRGRREGATSDIVRFTARSAASAASEAAAGLAVAELKPSIVVSPGTLHMGGIAARPSPTLDPATHTPAQFLAVSVAGPAGEHALRLVATALPSVIAVSQCMRPTVVPLAQA